MVDLNIIIVITLNFLLTVINDKLVNNNRYEVVKYIIFFTSNNIKTSNGI